MSDWPTFLRLLLSTFAVGSAITLGFVWYMTGETQHLGTLGGIWAICHLLSAFIRRLSDWNGI
jgi:hypothetical protein